MQEETNPTKHIFKVTRAHDSKTPLGEFGKIDHNIFCTYDKTQ